MASTTIYLLSGSATNISRRHYLEIPHVVPFSEKQILNIRKTIALMRADKSDFIYFGAKALELQRYHHIIKGLMLLAGKKHGGLIDENGVYIPYSPLRTIFVDSFRLLGEIIASIWVVVAAMTELALRKK